LQFLESLVGFVFIAFSLICFVSYRLSYGGIRAMIIYPYREEKFLTECLIKKMTRKLLLYAIVFVVTNSLLISVNSFSKSLIHLF
jgi:hypothetical protein